MKNELPEMLFTKDISEQPPAPKIFYRFVGTFDQVLSQKQIRINSHIILKLINQPQNEDVTKFTPQQKILVFGQVTQQNKLIEGQARSITLQQALKYQNQMRKIQNKAFIVKNNIEERKFDQ